MNEPSRPDGRKYLEKMLKAKINRGRYRFRVSVPFDADNFGFEIPRYASIQEWESNINTVIEESVDISLTETDFQKLLDVLSYFEKYNDGSDYAHYIVERAAFEGSLREKHPALKQAYEKYQLLVNLTADGKL